MDKVQFSGKSVLVLGLARSGVAVAQLLQRLGAQVTVNDASPRERVDADVRVLEAKGIRVITGGHPPELADACDLIVKNPGIPYDRPIIVRALARGVPVITEVEVAFQVTRATLIGITGSNGKTTTTTLVGEMLRAAGAPATVAGNIGTPLSAVALDATADQLLVAELSSFQLQGTVTLRPKIAALLHIYPAHLDYHGTLDKYIDAKMRLFANQEPGDIAILNGDQEFVAELAAGLAAEVWLVSANRRVAPGACLQDGMLVVTGSKVQDPVPIMDVKEIALRGEHNVQNALFAAAIAFAAGASPQAIAATLREFSGVEHRMEFVRQTAGVSFVNDSKATNPQATVKTITAFTEPIIAILGGLDRGDDLSALAAVAGQRLKAVLAIGESGPRMAEMALRAGVPLVFSVTSLPEAVQRAAALAETGDVVLLSPAAASWDMFKSFEERGRIFKEAVHML